MSVEEFKRFILSIGFEYMYDVRYEYKEFKIDLYEDYYHFYNGSEWYSYELNDLTLFKVFNQELRSFKLKIYYLCDMNMLKNNNEEFIKLIKSIRFILDFDLAYHRYFYKNYTIHIYDKVYDFFNGSEMVLYIKLNDLNVLKRIERSIKLKNILC